MSVTQTLFMWKNFIDGFVKVLETQQNISCKCKPNPPVWHHEHILSLSTHEVIPVIPEVDSHKHQTSLPGVKELELRNIDMVCDSTLFYLSSLLLFLSVFFLSGCIYNKNLPPKY